jgi:hypothetical protein
MPAPVRPGCNIRVELLDKITFGLLDKMTFELLDMMTFELLDRMMFELLDKSDPIPSNEIGVVD